MRRHIISVLSLTLVMAGPAVADTFDRASLAPELGVDALTRGVAKQQLGKEVFSNPYATVMLGNIDIYDVFPYVESRHFQVVSDPGWNRLVFGEVGQSLYAFDGQNSSVGPLSEPRGMAVDEQNRLYVADSGNDRVLVFQAVTEFDDMNLIPLYEIRDLGQPYDVAFSDGGTPFEPGDDHLYVAETGKNRVVAFSVDQTGAREVASIGDLGSGVNHFAGPMAISAGRNNSTNTSDVYVADAHNCRIVHLRHESGSLQWVGERSHDADIMTSLDTDHWGNVYAAAPNKDAVYKYSADLTPVASLTQDSSRPRNFHVPFLNVIDHRTGEVERRGQRSGIVIEKWSEATGMKRWNLGVEVADLAVVDGDNPAARFTLTDPASVRFEIKDVATGQTISSRTVGDLGTGFHSIALETAEFSGGVGSERSIRVTAVSGYSDGPSDVAETGFTVTSAGSVLPPNQPMLLGNSPNPAIQFTRISFMLPSAMSEPATLGVYDARGRLVRSYKSGFAPGLNEVDWNGRDNHGKAVSAGVYFYRLNVGSLSFTRRMVFVR